MNEDNEWELCKENVQPLRSGRQMKALKEALSKDSVALRNAIQEFETKLRSTDGEEQMDVWYSYILWMEQHFATGNQETLDLLKRCVIHYKDVKRFHQSEKLTHIWIKISERMDDPNEIFKYLFDQDIGTSLAIFYKSWAEHCEVIGSNQKADELYTLGINRNAEPVDVLLKCRKDFDTRMSKISLQVLDDSPPRQQRSRKALCSLKLNKQGKVGSERIKNITNSTSKISSGNNPPKSNQHSGFMIYGDENPTPAIPTETATGQYKHIPIDPSVNAENRKKMEVLKGAKLKGAGTTLSSSVTKFEIYSEENEIKNNPTPKQVVVSARKPLSTKKAEKNPYRFFDPNENDPNIVIKYCKSVIYMGSKEVSFEELKSKLLKYSNESSRKAVRSKLTFPDMPVIKQRDDEKHQLSEESSSKPTLNINKDIMNDHSAHLKTTHPSDVTLMLNTIVDQKEIGFPNYESTNIFNVQSTIPFGDIYMQSPTIKSKNQDCDMCSPDMKGPCNKTGWMLSELNQTTIDPSNRFDKVQNIEDMEIGGSTKCQKNIQNCLDELDVTRIAWTQREEDTIESSQTSNKNNAVEKDTLDDKLDIGIPDIVNKVDEDELKRLSALSGVTLDIFGNKKLNQASFSEPSHDFKMEPDNFKTNVAQKEVMSMPNDDLISQMKALNTSDLFDNRTSCYAEMQFQQSVLSKTPTNKRSLGFSHAIPDNLCAPSPTMNTKDAISNVQAMFTEPLDQEKFDSSENDMPTLSYDMQFETGFEGLKMSGNLDEQQKSKSFPIFSDKHQPKSLGNQQKSKPFSIFSDSQQQESRDDKQSSKPFSIYSDVQQSSKSFQIHSESIEPNEFMNGKYTEKGENLRVNDTGKFDRCGNGAEGKCLDDEFSIKIQALHEEEKTSHIGIPKRPVSTPFLSNDCLSVTFGQNLSGITAATKFGKTNASMTGYPSLDLSTIQERSNEDVHSPDCETSGEEVYINAFSANLKAELLASVERRITSSENFLVVSGPLPKLQGACTELYLGPRHIRINKCILKGGISATYKAVNHFNQSVALKISKTDDKDLWWDFYISNEIHNRLSDHHLTDYRKNFVHHNMVYKYSDSACVETQFYSEGTLMDLISLYKRQNCCIDEALAMLYTFEILRIIDTLHRLNIIHGNLKPENFLQADCEITEAGPLSIRCLKLKEFDSCIDLSLISDSRKFMFVGSNNSDSFECEEMRTGKPWKFQVDYYAAAATIHLLIFQSFMNTYVDPKNQLVRICNPIKRGWNEQLWNKIFSMLIDSSQKSNVLPNLLTELARCLEQAENISKLEQSIIKKNDLLMSED